MVGFKIWTDNADRDKADWIAEHTKLSSLSPEVSTILHGANFAKNPRLIQDVLYLGKPDIVLTYTQGILEIPFLAVTLTHQKPMGLNVHQHFTSLAAASETGIPSAFIFPYSALVERKAAQSGISADIARPLLAMCNIIRFYKVPCLAYQWPADAKGRLQYDSRFPNAPPSNSRPIEQFFLYVDLLIDTVLQRRDYGELLEQPEVSARVSEMWNLVAKPRLPDYPPAVSEITTADLVDYVRSNVKTPTAGVRDDLVKFQLSQLLASREKTVIFRIGAKMYPDNNNKVIQNPYAGALAVYDYCYTRSGKTSKDRYKNLVLHFSDIRLKQFYSIFHHYWEDSCPFGSMNPGARDYLMLHLRDGCRYTRPSQLKVFFSLSDMVILADEVIFE